MNHYKIEKIICIGEGVGADICATFAIIHPTRCKGLCLIRPNGSLSSLNEQLSYIKNELDGNKSENLNETLFAYLVWQRYGIKPNQKSNSLLSFIILNPIKYLFKKSMK